MKPPNKGHLRITDKSSCTNLSVIKRFPGADLEPEVEGGPMLAACGQRGKGAGGGVTPSAVAFLSSIPVG